MRSALAITIAIIACGKSPPPRDKNVTDGVRVVLVSPSGGDIEAAGTVVRRRLDLAKMPAQVTTKDGKLVVDIPTASQQDIANTKALIEITARIEIRPLDEEARALALLVSRVPPSPPVDSAIDEWKDNAGQAHGSPFLYAPAKKPIEDYVTANQLPSDREVLYQQLDAKMWRTFFALRESPVPLASASAAVKGDAVEITLSPDGKAALAKLTRGQAGHKLVFLVDGRVVSAPIIAGEVPGGTFSMVNVEQPALLAIAVSGGALPTPLVEESVSLLKGGKVQRPQQ